MQEIKKVSVIIPAYNVEPYIEETIQSIQQQGHEAIEIIVVDDGSTDNTLSICEQQDVILIKQEHQGVAVARNAGLAAATGDFIAFLDADDLWAENKLKSQLAAFEQSPEIMIVLGKSMPIDKEGKPLADPMFLLSLCGILAKREVFEQIGNFDEQLTYAEDMDWFIRTMEQDCEVVITQDLALKFRRHDTNMTKNQDVLQRFLLKAIKRSLDRRREQNNGATPTLSQMKVPKSTD